MRARINEIAQKFGVRVPVYLLMTKLDLLAGFTEFFDNFDATTREQVWGHTFELEGEAKSQLQDMPAAYAALVQRVGDRLLDRTQAERDVQRRGLIFAFPQQFAQPGSAADRAFGSYRTRNAL